MDRDVDGEKTGASEEREVTDDEKAPAKGQQELADLDPNAEEAARKVERQLRRLRRETR